MIIISPLPRVVIMMVLDSSRTQVLRKCSVNPLYLSMVIMVVLRTCWNNF